MSATATYEFEAELWPWEARTSSWIFVSLPHDVTDEIDDRFGGRTGRGSGGFGSIPVEVTIGATTWTTSVFPSKQEATYVLPIKKPVRAAEGLSTGDVATVTLTVQLDA